MSDRFALSLFFEELQRTLASHYRAPAQICRPSWQCSWWCFTTTEGARGKKQRCGERRAWSDWPVQLRSGPRHKIAGQWHTGASHEHSWGLSAAGDHCPWKSVRNFSLRSGVDLVARKMRISETNQGRNGNKRDSKIRISTQAATQATQANERASEHTQTLLQAKTNRRANSKAIHSRERGNTPTKDVEKEVRDRCVTKKL